MRAIKQTGMISGLISLAIAFIFYLAFPGKVNLIWIAVILSSSASFAIISAMIAARNLYFLAGSVPHSALLSAGLAILTSLTIGGNSFLWNLSFNVLMILTVGYAIHKGADPNRVTSIFVGITASLTVTVLYYLINHFYLARSVTSEILGDPLLSTTADAYISLAALSFTVLIFAFSYKENLLIGIFGRDSWLSGINVYFYDYIFYLLLAVVSASFMKIVGFILTHIFILIPGAIASMVSSSSIKAINVAIGISTLSASIGLILGVIFNLSPAGITGIVMMLIYGFILIGKKVK
ncbi:MAG: metal ABC transporter permease [Fervidicoccaceae archaeon]